MLETVLGHVCMLEVPKDVRNTGKCSLVGDFGDEYGNLRDNSIERLAGDRTTCVSTRQLTLRHSTLGPFVLIQP